MTPAREASVKVRPVGDDLWVVVYMSAATRPFRREELLDLLTTARAYNMAAGITGLLLYHAHGFLQALEGPRGAVHTLLGQIRRDVRHHRMLVVLDGPRTQRYFPDWAMGFVDVGATPPPAGFSTLLTDPDARRELRAHPDRVHQLLRCYAEHELGEQVAIAP